MISVKKKCCNQCLYGKNKIVSDDRKAQLLEEIKQDDSFFICHKASIEGQKDMCRGFYDDNDTQLIQVAGRLNVIDFVD